MDTRSREDRIAGILRIGVGGVEKIVPTLPKDAIHEWQAGLSVGAAAAVSEDDLKQDDFARLVDLSLDEILNVVVSYDRTSALGGREWLEKHADPAQLYEAATQMADVSFPFVRDPPEILRALIGRSVAVSMSASSTSTPSSIGTSTPEPSTTLSTPSK